MNSGPYESREVLVDRLLWVLVVAWAVVGFCCLGPCC